MDEFEDEFNSEVVEVFGDVCVTFTFFRSKKIFRYIIHFFFLYSKGPEQENVSSKWSRPEPPALNPLKDGLCFQQIEVDHYTGKF